MVGVTYLPAYAPHFQTTYTCIFDHNMCVRVCASTSYIHGGIYIYCTWGGNNSGGVGEHAARRGTQVKGVVEFRKRRGGEGRERKVLDDGWRIKSVVDSFHADSLSHQIIQPSSVLCQFIISGTSSFSSGV